MKNKRRQSGGAMEGIMISKGKKNVKDFIFWDLDSNIRDLELIFYAETNGTISLQAPLDKILALKNISVFAQTVAELYCHGCWLKNYLDNEDGFLDAEYLDLSHSFCMITGQISAARELSESEKTAVVASTANQRCCLNSGIERKKISEYVRNKLIEIEKANPDDTPTAIYKKWRKWRQEDLYDSINNDETYLDDYKHGDAKKIKTIKDEIEDKVNDPDYEIIGRTKREDIARELYKRLLEKKLIHKYPTKTLKGWLNEEHKKNKVLPTISP